MAASGIPKNSVTATNPIKLPSMVRSLSRHGQSPAASARRYAHGFAEVPRFMSPGAKRLLKLLDGEALWQGAMPRLGGRFFDNARGLTSGRNRSVPWSRAREPLAACDGVLEGSAWKRFRRRYGKPRKESAHQRAHRGRRRWQKAGVESVGRRASRTERAGDGRGRTVPVRALLRGGREHLRRAPRRRLRAWPYRKSGCHNGRAP